jgi:hypothetical protein
MDQDIYDRLKFKLVIDTTRLTEELEELPQLQSDASDGYAEAQRDRDDAKDTLEIAKATAAELLRYDLAMPKQRSEATISSELLLDPNVQAAMEAFRIAEYNLSVWKSVADSMRSKKDAIRTISDLIASGYTTPTAIYSTRKRMDR